MSPSLRLELTRLFFKLGPPGRMTGQRDAVDFQTGGTQRGSNLALGQDDRSPRSGRGGRRFKSCHSDQHLAPPETSIPTVSPTDTRGRLAIPAASSWRTSPSRPRPLEALPSGSALARLLAQFTETLAIAPSALGSAHCLTAKQRTPFPPRVHYKLGIWLWGRYSRWLRPHELGELHDFYTPPNQILRLRALQFG